MALEGERIVVFDKENGAYEYARRLSDMRDAWKLSDAELRLVDKNFRYIEYPNFREADGPELVSWVREEHFDLAVFDSQRMVLSDMGLRENEADDIARFINGIILPLSKVKVTTLTLDNTGHTDRHRSRGSVSKIDLNEVSFSVDSIQDFDLFQRGKLKMAVEQTRFGNRGTWTMELGGGHFGDWEAGDGPMAVKKQRTPRDLILSAVPFDGQEMSGNALESLCSGQGVGVTRLRRERAALVDEGVVTKRGGEVKGQAAFYSLTSPRRT